MARAIKLQNNTYLDTSGIVHNRQILADKLLLPYILYSNNSGSSTDITLTDSVSNYEYIDVYYIGVGHNRTGGQVQRCYLKHNNCFTLLAQDYSSDTSRIYFYCTRYQATNKTITPVNYRSLTLISGNTISLTDSNSVAILKVIGYK